MRSALFAAVVSAAAATTTITVSAQTRFPFSRQQHNHDDATTPVQSAGIRGDPGNTNSSNDRRALSLQLFFQEIDWTYVVNASVGTPPQNLTLAVAPSASSSWVVQVDERYYNDYPYHSDVYPHGAFVPGRSSTFELLDNNTFSGYGRARRGQQRVRRSRARDAVGWRRR